MSSNRITYVIGRNEDLATAADFYEAMFNDMGRDISDWDADWRHLFAEYFKRRMSAREARWFFARDGERHIGSACGIIRDGYPHAIHRKKSGYIAGVYVLPEYRRQGIARELTEDAIAFLKESGCAKVRLHASQFGQPLYEKMGFTRTNELELRLR